MDGMDQILYDFGSGTDWFEVVNLCVLGVGINNFSYT